MQYLVNFAETKQRPDFCCFISGLSGQNSKLIVLVGRTKFGFNSAGGPSLIHFTAATRVDQNSSLKTMFRLVAELQLLQFDKAEKKQLYFG